MLCLYLSANHGHYIGDEDKCLRSVDLKTSFRMGMACEISSTPYFNRKGNPTNSEQSGQNGSVVLNFLV